MADINEVPVIDVHLQNFKELWPTMLLAIKTSTFVALDAELSGLGQRKLINARSVEDRYTAMCEVAKTRSILSIGLSCFKCQGKENDTESCKEVKNDTHSSYQVQTFNILLLCSENYVVEPLSLRFLVEHGFDFNKQYAYGIPYERGNDKKKEEYLSMRWLFAEIISNKVPLVFHNAMVDLVFLYQCLYADVPASLPTFLADYSEMLPGGIFDTKYITEFHARYPSSYLEYVFRKSQRENHLASKSGSVYTAVNFLSYPTNCDHVSVLNCGLDTKSSDDMKGKTEVCSNFSAYGWCTAGRQCTKSHDIDLILDHEDEVTEKKRQKKRRKKRQHSESDSNKQQESVSNETKTDTAKEEMMDSVSNDNKNETPSGTNNGATDSSGCRTTGHRAGFDSFMTGFSFAYFITKFGEKEFLHDNKLDNKGVNNFVNKITLSGKDIPLQIAKSAFARTSKNHREKMIKLQR